MVDQSSRPHYPLHRVDRTSVLGAEDDYEKGGGAAFLPLKEPLQQGPPLLSEVAVVGRLHARYCLRSKKAEAAVKKTGRSGADIRDLLHLHLLLTLRESE